MDKRSTDDPPQTQPNPSLPSQSSSSRSFHNSASDDDSVDRLFSSVFDWESYLADTYVIKPTFLGAHTGEENFDKGHYYQDVESDADHSSLDVNLESLDSEGQSDAKPSSSALGGTRDKVEDDEWVYPSAAKPPSLFQPDVEVPYRWLNATPRPVLQRRRRRQPAGRKSGACLACRISKIRCHENGICPTCRKSWPNHAHLTCIRMQPSEAWPVFGRCPDIYSRQPLEESRIMDEPRIFIGKTRQMLVFFSKDPEAPALRVKVQAYRRTDESEGIPKVGIPRDSYPSHDELLDWGGFARKVFRMSLIFRLWRQTSFWCRDPTDDIVPLPLSIQAALRGSAHKALEMTEHDILKDLDEILSTDFAGLRKDRLTIWASLWQSILMYRDLIAQVDLFKENQTHFNELSASTNIRALTSLQDFFTLIAVMYHYIFRAYKRIHFSNECLEIPGTLAPESERQALRETTSKLLDARKTFLRNFQLSSIPIDNLLCSLVVNHELKILYKRRRLPKTRRNVHANAYDEDASSAAEQTQDPSTNRSECFDKSVPIAPHQPGFIQEHDLTKDGKSEVELTQEKTDHGLNTGIPTYVGQNNAPPMEPPNATEFVDSEIMSQNGTSSRADSDLESMFSGITLPSKTSISIGEQQDDGSTLLTDLLFRNHELNPLYTLASEKVSSEKLHKNLRGFFRNYGRDLKQEAKNEPESQAAIFMLRSAGNVTRAILEALRKDRFGTTLPLDTRNTMEKTVERWFTSLGTSEEQGIQINADSELQFRGSTDESGPSGDEDEYQVSGGEESEEELALPDMNPSPKVLDEVKQFLMSSSAFQTLKVSLRRWLKLDEAKHADLVPPTTQPQPSQSSLATGDPENLSLRDAEESDADICEAADVAPTMVSTPAAQEVKDLRTDEGIANRKVAIDPAGSKEDPGERACLEMREEENVPAKTSSKECKDSEEKKSKDCLSDKSTHPAVHFPASSRAARFYRMLLEVLSSAGCIEEDIRPGRQRVRWTNRRGQRLYDDYLENELGAIQSLQEYLHTSAYGSRSSQEQSRTYAVFSFLFGSFSSRRAAQTENISHGDPANEGQENASRGNDGGQSQQDFELGGLSPDSLHILSCMEKKGHGIDLHLELVSHIADDRELFRTLRESYRKHRGRLRPYWSLRTIHSLHFMKFAYGGPRYIDVRCHDEICEQGKPCDCIPPIHLVRPNGTEYECSPVPSKLSPPIGRRLMMDFFTDPDSIGPDSNFVLRQLPKRTSGEISSQSSELTEAWGIYYKEDWDWVKIWFILAVGFFPPSLLFGILWGVLRKDIQGAFGIASWWMTGSTIIIGIIGTYTWAV